MLRVLVLEKLFQSKQRTPPGQRVENQGEDDPPWAYLHLAVEQPVDLFNQPDSRCVRGHDGEKPCIGYLKGRVFAGHGEPPRKGPR
jgi:hypothetical protein